MKIQDVITTIMADVPGERRAETVDNVKIGDADQTCTGIVVTFLATVEVIEKAAQIGANLIITHESPFFKHQNHIEYLLETPVYLEKRRYIEERGVTIWRFHDALHEMIPDPTVAGIAETLGWDDNELDNLFGCYEVPPTTLRQLAVFIKDKMGLESVEVAGDLDMACQTVAIMAGFPGSERLVTLLNHPDVDVVITGEIFEWEGAEYARDAGALGLGKAFIVLGHVESEDPGMRWFTDWLKERLPEMTITFVACGSPYQTI